MIQARRRSPIKISLGAKALDLALSLPAIIPNLQFLEFTVYSPSPGAKKRIAKAQFLSPKDKAKELLRNDSIKNQNIRLSIDGFAEWLPKIISGLSRTQALGINSKCWLKDGSDRQIPMMDFKPKPGDANLEQIKQSLVKMGQRGALLESGASYHFYGFNVLDQKDWVDFLGQSLLDEFSDSRWIGHSLIQGSCILRVTGSDLKRTIPVFRCLVG